MRTVPIQTEMLKANNKLEWFEYITLLENRDNLSEKLMTALQLDLLKNLKGNVI